MQHLTTDVLIVGGGLAGLRAAIAGADLGLRVLVISKTQPALDNSTAVAEGHISGAVGGITAEEYLSRLEEKSGGHADRVLQRVLAYETAAVIAELRNRFGVDYAMRRGVVVVPGSYPWRGLGITRPLIEYAHTKGVEFLSPVCAGDLLTVDGRCAGVTGLDLASGETIAIRARSTVLCGGGHAGIYPRHDNRGRTTGDCVAMAMRAGARVRDLAFVHFHGLGFAEGQEPFDAANLGSAFRKGELRLADGTPARRSDLPHVWEERATSRERDDERFDAFLDLTAVDWQSEAFARIRDLVLPDFPVESEPVRVSPLAHYTTGGIAIDQQGATSIPHLYAAGECTGGVFGAGRPGGAALVDCLVFGRRAGYEAARLARASDAEPPGAEVTPWNLTGPDDPTPLLEEARAYLWNYASVADCLDGLEVCRTRLAELAAAGLSSMPGSPAQWLAWNELRSVTAIGARMIQEKLQAGA